jgi:hypothetical protein
MFLNLQLEVMDRFTAVKQHFRESSRRLGNERRTTKPGSDRWRQTAKGLVFVQIYAIHEYTVLEVLRIATAAIVAHSHAYMDLRPSLLALFLNPELCSLRDTAPKNIWEKRLELFARATSKNRISLGGVVLPAGNHFRHDHINFILKVLGVARKLTARQRHLYLIDTVVDKRNSIAHGEETAAEVGRNFSRQEILQIIDQFERICFRLILIVSEYCNEPAMHCR